MRVDISRVLVVGISGTGKTRLARTLAEGLNVPVVHLDSIFWCDGWQERDGDQVVEMIHDVLCRDAWVLEGYIEPLGRERVQRAHVVVYLDLSGTAAVVGVVSRWVRHRRRARPELPATNTDSFSMSFLKMVARRAERYEIEGALAGANNVVRVRTRRAARRLTAARLTEVACS